MTYAELDAFLGSKPNRPARLKNTRILRTLNGITVRYCQTDVVTFRPDGSIVLQSGGYRTATTKERINQYVRSTGWHLSVKAGVWLLHHDDQTVPFRDGCVLRGDKVKGAGNKRDLDRTKRLRQRVRQYGNLFINRLLQGEVPAPSAADCWFCCFKGQDGKPWGELSGSDHLEVHLKERYCVPSLLVRAIEVFPVSEFARWWLGARWGQVDPNRFGPSCAEDLAARQIRQSLVRYLDRQLGLG